MRIAFLFFVLFHGLLHLPGYLKAFGYRELKELTLPISRSWGLIWLSASILMLLYGILFFTNSRYAWMAGMAAVAISQILIFFFWKDARFGTLPNLIVLSATLMGLGAHLMKSKFAERVEHDFNANNASSTSVLSDSDLDHLPVIVQKYLHYTKAVGQPMVKNFRAEFSGRMRGKPEDNYMQFQSVQYNFYQEPSRYFFMEARKMGLPATGLHVYQSEKATFQVKMLNWLRVVDARGEKLNQAVTVTLFNDMCCIAPATLIDSRITWESVNDTTVKAFYTNGKIRISAVLYFNKEGALLNFISNDRYETDGKQYNNYPWSTPVEDYGMINGYFLPGKAKLIYHKSDGDFVYGELEYKSVAYNLSGRHSCD